MSATGPELKAGDGLPGTKYRVVKALGAGGMGVVYQVVKPPNIQGVLKLMSTELTRHEEHRLRFFDEVRILAQLDHPNIVKVFDYDALPDGTPFYVMELLSGRTVRDVIYTMGRVPPRVAYEITRQLLEALQAAHTHEVPVIHRDIKPENIFLHAPRHGEPVVKLIDFGVSAVADRKHDGAFVGTWSYAAPEQIRGEKPTPATDLYAAGLVLYEMLAGVGPFDHHEDWTKVSEAQLNELPAPLSKFAPWVPASIVALIQSALAKDPRVRPRDAYAFAERLYELEWASDGKDPHDFTAEGPALAARAAGAGGGAGAVRRGRGCGRGRGRLVRGPRPGLRAGRGCGRVGAGLRAGPGLRMSRRRRSPEPQCGGAGGRRGGRADRDRRERTAIEGAQHDHVDVAGVEQEHGCGFSRERSARRRPADRRAGRRGARRIDVARRGRTRSHVA
ncbi:MAG: serine/threonine protein kinase [Labilithrix sp.]|nr:serine/threonine protein kinase [Labilithrix sp.]